ncbi:MAG TPA: T9SS type A sorting domain-containing protein, partial [Bacteroidales bacterium]|nr:T9SS type A sorting domain-containing protein [Bacteroidales bacterium]
MVTGRVTDISGATVPNARVSMTAGTTEYAAITGADGRYSLRISGIYTTIPGLLEMGTPYPNPFSHSVNIPFIINSSGDIRVNIFNLRGEKIKELYFPSVAPGSYRVIWDGRNQGGATQSPGIYFYAITFQGRTWSGRLVKAEGFSTYSASTALEMLVMPPVTPSPSGAPRIPVITQVTCTDYYPVRLTDITIARDTVIDLELCRRENLPFKTAGNYIAMHTGSDYRPLMLKGINLGSSPPGYFPGEIAYAIAPDIYEKWIKQMAESGFNSIRIYTLHPPVFYEKLAEYNQRNPDNPLLLFQG